MQLSGIASCLVFQSGSTIKSPWVHTVTSWYPPHHPTSLSHNHEVQFHTSPYHYLLVWLPLLQICSLRCESGKNHPSYIMRGNMCFMLTLMAYTVMLGYTSCWHVITFYSMWHCQKCKPGVMHKKDLLSECTKHWLLYYRKSPHAISMLYSPSVSYRYLFALLHYPSIIMHTTGNCQIQLNTID